MKKHLTVGMLREILHSIPLAEDEKELRVKVCGIFPIDRTVDVIVWVDNLTWRNGEPLIWLDPCVIDFR